MNVKVNPLYEGKSERVEPFMYSTPYTLTEDDYRSIWAGRGASYLTEQSEANLPEFLAATFPLAAEGKTEEDEQAHQMKYEFETLIRGTRFTHEFVLENCNNIERSCFKRMIDLWNERPYLGGKSSTGYGKIKLDYPDINTLSNKAYLDYLNDNKDKITVFLDDLVGKWK